MMRGIELVGAAIGTLMLICPAHSQGAIGQGDWQKIEADNGAIYQIYKSSISRNRDGTADLLVYVGGGANYIPTNLRRLWFDCKGRYRDISPDGGIRPTLDAPPRSVAGRLSEIACAGAKDTRFSEPAPPQPKETPAQYCAGFSREACARITTAVEAKPKPSFCKPGYGLTGSGLSPEQVQICRTITNEEIRLENNSERLAREKSSQTGRYNLDLSATRSKFPNIVGSTNLPDGTKLMISINKPRLPNAKELLAAGLPMCEENCFPASGPNGESLGLTTTVLAGAFSAGPFSWAGKPFRQGVFEVEVYLVSLPGEDGRRKVLEMQLERMKKPILTTSVAVAPQ